MYEFVSDSPELVAVLIAITGFLVANVLARVTDRLLMRLPKEALEGVNPALVVAAGVIAYHDTKFRGIDPFEDVVPTPRIR